MTMETADDEERSQVVDKESVLEDFLLLPVADGAFVHDEVLLLQVHDGMLLPPVVEGAFVHTEVPLVLASGEASVREPVLARELVLP